MFSFEFAKFFRTSFSENAFKRLPLKLCSDILQNSALKNFASFTGKHMCWSLFLIKVQTWRHANLLKRNSNTPRFCPVKIEKLLRTTFKNNLRWLLLIFIDCCSKLKLFKCRVVSKSGLTSGKNICSSVLKEVENNSFYNMPSFWEATFRIFADQLEPRKPPLKRFVFFSFSFWSFILNWYKYCIN